MTDIIERLRIESRREPHEPIWRDAIDEIEALRAEVDRVQQSAAQSSKVQGLINALQEVVDAADGGGWKVLDPSFEKQRAALAAIL